MAELIGGVRVWHKNEWREYNGLLPADIRPLPPGRDTRQQRRARERKNAAT